MAVITLQSKRKDKKNGEAQKWRKTMNDASTTAEFNANCVKTRSIGFAITRSLKSYRKWRWRLAQIYQIKTNRPPPEAIVTSIMVCVHFFAKNTAIQAEKMLLRLNCALNRLFCLLKLFFLLFIITKCPVCWENKQTFEVCFGSLGFKFLWTNQDGCQFLQVLWVCLRFWDGIQDVFCLLQPFFVYQNKNVQFVKKINKRLKFGLVLWVSKSKMAASFFEFVYVFATEFKMAASFCERVGAICWKMREIGGRKMKKRGFWVNNGNKILVPTV